MLTPEIATTLLEAEAKALATTGPHGVNVVPVSVLTIAEDIVYLYDFFMGKTVENLCAAPTVALTAWSGLCGVQIKATATYYTSGEPFDKALAQMKEQFPERTLRGVIALAPYVVYDIGVGLETAGQVVVGSAAGGEGE